MRLSFDKVTDIPELDLMNCLLALVKMDVAQPDDENAMAVDDPSTTKTRPPASLFLGYCVDYPLSSSSLQVAIRKVFTNADHLSTLLRIMDTWLTDLLNRNIDVSIGKLTIKNDENDVPIAKPRVRPKIGQRALRPSLENVCTNIACVLQSLLKLLFIRSPYSFKPF